jgi:hypothetical protein
MLYYECDLEQGQACYTLRAKTAVLLGVSIMKDHDLVKKPRYSKCKEAIGNPALIPDNPDFHIPPLDATALNHRSYVFVLKTRTGVSCGEEWG